MTKKEIVSALLDTCTPDVLKKLESLDGESARIARLVIERASAEKRVKSAAKVLKVILDQVNAIVAQDLAEAATGTKAPKKTSGRQKKTTADPNVECPTCKKEGKVTLVPKSELVKGECGLCAWGDTPKAEIEKAKKEKAEEDRQAAEAARKKAAKDGKTEPKKSSRSLTITEPVDVTLSDNSKTFEGQLLPNGHLVFDGVDYSSPCQAMQKLLKKRAAAWQLVTFKDKDGTRKPIDALRTKPKGFTLYEGKPRGSSGPRRSPAEASVAKAKERIDYFERKKTQAEKSRQEWAVKLDAAEAQLAQESVDPQEAVDRKAVLDAMSAKEVSAIAKEKEITGFKKKDEKVRGILLAEFGAYVVSKAFPKPAASAA